MINTVLPVISSMVSQMFAAPAPAPAFWLTTKFGLSEYPLLCALFKSDEELALLKAILEEMAAAGLGNASPMQVQQWVWKRAMETQRQAPNGAIIIEPAIQAFINVKGRYDEAVSASSKPHKVVKAFKVEAEFLWKDVAREVTFHTKNCEGIGSANIDQMTPALIVDLQGKYTQHQQLLNYWKIRQAQARLICRFVGFEPK